MNELLFEREKGTLSSASVIRVVTHKSLHSLQLYPWINFDGGERAPVIQAPGSSRQQTVDETYINDEPTEVFVTKKKDREAIWAHQAGVTALDVEGYGHRL